MSDPIKMGCDHNEPKTTEPVPKQSNKTPVNHSHQLINPPVQRSARLNEDLQPERFEQDESQPQRNRQRLWQRQSDQPIIYLQRCRWILSYFPTTRGPRVIRNREGCNENNSIVGQQQRKQAAAAVSEITTITDIMTITKITIV